jgi:hypothetical protein
MFFFHFIRLLCNQFLTIPQATFVRLPGFNPVVHLLFREVFTVISEYFAKNPAVEHEAPDNWNSLIQLNDELLATIAEHPVSPRVLCIYPVL